MSALLCARVHVIGVFKPIKSIITFKYNDDDGDNIIVVRQYHCGHNNNKCKKTSVL